MWKKIVVLGEIHLYSCTYALEQYKVLVYNPSRKTAFCENIFEDSYMQRSMQLNKRIKYAEGTIRTTLTTADSVEANLYFQSFADGEVALLKFKYRVNESPLNCEWHLSSMETSELLESMLIPAIKVMNNLLININELRDCIIKKDLEIEQYKTEGAVLRRSTVATKKFELSSFDNQYYIAQECIKGYGLVASCLEGNELDHISNFPKKQNPPTCTLPEKKKIPNNTENIKLSPRNRKRKALEYGRIHLQRKVLQRRDIKQLQYKDSQSQDEQLSNIELNAAILKNNDQQIQSTFNSYSECKKGINDTLTDAHHRKQEIVKENEFENDDVSDNDFEPLRYYSSDDEVIENKA